jgi:hypothetical protein
LNVGRLRLVFLGIFLGSRSSAAMMLQLRVELGR